MESEYWLDDRGVPLDIVELAEARCSRCPEPIRCVPVDKTWITQHPAGRTFVQYFVCPHCRIGTRGHISEREALRLFAAGIDVVRAGVTPLARQLSEDDLIEFGRALAMHDDVARLALEGSTPDSRAVDS